MKRNTILKGLVFFIPIFLITIVGITYGAMLYNDEEVIPNTNLTYYVNVYYDGVDIDGIKSNNATMSDVNSGYMIIEDKIPNGLTFTGFVTTDNGSIGSVNRSDGSPCAGSVVDDTKEEAIEDGTWNDNNSEYYYHGLHYNVETKTVTFKVKNLKAGCKLTVGIKTRIPANTDNPNTADYVEVRKDFYNIATVRDNNMTSISNIFHLYAGKGVKEFHKVHYQYTGNVPTNVPTIPDEYSYSKGDQVGIVLPINVEGYIFSGWETADVSIENDSFTMPDHDVTFTGYYTELSKHKVKYVIDGDMPTNYVVPVEKSYYPDNSVNIDILKVGDIYNGYIFSGWETNDLTLDDETKFVMPDHDVTFTGHFSEVKYKVQFAFYDTVKPSNANEIIPQSLEYKPGEIVSLPTINNIDGYRFLGWNRESNFIMPNGDITVYGEWIQDDGDFEPTISIEIIDPKEIYHANDIVKFAITITNNYDYSINDVIIRENNLNAEFIEGEEYDVQSKHYARIAELPANSTRVLYSTYQVQKSDYDKVVNEVELVGGLVSTHKLLTNTNLKKSVDFKVLSNLVVHHYINGTATKVYDDEIQEIPFGVVYETSPKDTSQLYDDYRNKYKLIDSSDNVKGVVSNNYVEVIYYYAQEAYKISVSVIGGVGTITGDEVVNGGSNSKEDIIITPGLGYEINKILINGQEIEITNSDEMKLDKFENVKEHKNIEVEFKEKPQEAPITGKYVSIYFIVNLLASFALIMFILYKKYVSKNTNGGQQ